MQFWRWLTTSRYTRRLEDENGRLAAENERLLRLLLPRLNQAIFPIAGSVQEKANEANQQSASAGDRFADPGVLKFKRTNWTEARNKLETMTSKDIQTEQRMQKAVNAHANI